MYEHSTHLIVIVSQCILTAVYVHCCSPERIGLLNPATSDGRIIFLLPWQGATIAGTTDTKCEVTDNPTPTETEVQFILKEIRDYLNPDVDGASIIYA